MDKEGHEEPSRALLRRAHDDYRRRYQEWSVLRDGGLTSALSSALARMPKVKRCLDIREGGKNGTAKLAFPFDLVNPPQELLFQVTGILRGLQLLNPAYGESTWADEKFPGLAQPFSFLPWLNEQASTLPAWLFGRQRQDGIGLGR